MSATPPTIPVRPGLWIENTEQNQGPRLLGSQCQDCGEVFFPARQNGVCGWCQSDNLREILLGPNGEIYSVTVVMQRPPVYYHGEVPYAVGFVELPQRVMVESLFTGCDPEDLSIGMKVKLVIDELCRDENGNRVQTYKFRPVTMANEGAK